MFRDTIDVKVTPGQEVTVRLRNPFRNVLPEEARRHAYQAGREALLAVRSVLDAAVERVSERERRAAAARREIKVE